MPRLKHSPQRPALGVLHPAAADGSSQVDEAAAGCVDGGDGTQRQTGPPRYQGPTGTQASEARK